MAPVLEETEVKFYVRHLPELVKRIGEMHGRLRKARGHELNLRYDNANGDFRRTRQVLRLRRDRVTRLTYKEGGRIANGIFHRKEIEFEVDDFVVVDQFLQALGFQVAFRYEKYRTTYAIADQEIDLDELPIGDFIEIEGAPSTLRPIAEKLGLKWPAAVPYSYHDLFERLRISRQLPFADLTFEEFAALSVTPEDLGVIPADE